MHKRDLEKASKLQQNTNAFNKSSTSQGGWRKRGNRSLFQMLALLLRAKPGGSSAGVAVILVWMPVRSRLRGCAKWRASRSLLTTAFPCPLSILPLLYVLCWQGRCENQRLQGQTRKALHSWKVTYKLQVLIWQQEYLYFKMKLLLQGRFTDSNSSCKFCHLFRLWISKHIWMEREPGRVSHKCPWGGGEGVCGGVMITVTSW